MFTFDTGLTEDVFAKTRLVEHLTEPGLLAVSDGEGGFAFNEWAFNSTQMKDGNVLLCGDEWGDSPVPLLDCFTGSHGSINRNNALSVCVVINAMQAAASRHCEDSENNKGDEATLPTAPVGAGGIYVSADITRVLFLPTELFDQVVSMRGAEEYAHQQGLWICKALLSYSEIAHSEMAKNSSKELPSAKLCGSEATSFTVASLAYCALTGRPPYANMDETERDADIYDKQYLPLELAVNGVDAKLAAAVNGALEMPSALRSSAAISAISAIDTAALLRELTMTGKRSGAVDDEVFAERVAEYRKTHGKQVKASRTLRRNRALIITAVIGAIIVVIASVSLYRTAMSRPTMQGLNSREVVEVFYRAINEQDVTMLTTAAHGKVAHEFGDGISQIFVSGKMRGMYESGGIITMEEYLVRYANGTLKAPGATSSNFGIYGLTNITIDGAASNCDVKVPIKKERPIPAGQKDSALADGNTETHTVRYYSVHTEGEAVDLFCEKHTDHVTLTYTKNKWRVTNVVQDIEEVATDFESFLSDLDKAMKAHSGNISAATAELKQKYVWLPLLSCT